MKDIKKENSFSKYRVAALIPCLNEEATIESTINNIRTNVPNVHVCVCDNGSKDNTIYRAKKSGAFIITESKKGKGAAVDRLFQTVEADIYIMVDGDNTYDLTTLKSNLELMIKEKADMIIGVRRAKEENVFPVGHQLGNKLFNLVIEICFGKGITDVLSGYRVLSKKFVKNYPNLAQEFDIEVEMSVHALEINCKIIENEINYFKRPENSESKLRTFVDGFKILSRILILLIDNKPILIFLSIAFVFLLCAILFLFPIFVFWLDNGTVPRMPTLILGLVFVIISSISIFFGIVLESLSRQRKEIKKVIFKTSL
jgi:glycosyltransferase involved in cell wall biosynthesis